MLLIQINKKSYNVPENWNELTGRQLLQVMDSLFVKSYSTEQLVLKLFQIITGMSSFRLAATPISELEDFIYLVSFLFKPVDITKNVLLRYKNFYGPDDEAGNLIMQEFVFSEGYFMNWFENKEDAGSINSLISVLYRPGKRGYNKKLNPDGDIREPYNQNACNYYAKKKIAKWPLQVKLAIAYWYSACRQKLVNDNPDVFGGSGEPAKYGLVSIMMNVAEDGVFGDFDKVEKKHVNLMLMHLNEVVEKAKKMEKQTAA